MRIFPPWPLNFLGQTPLKKSRGPKQAMLRKLLLELPTEMMTTPSFCVALTVICYVQSTNLDGITNFSKSVTGSPALTGLYPNLLVLHKRPSQLSSGITISTVLPHEPQARNGGGGCPSSRSFSG